MSQIILASASPRRKELLEQIGAEFVVCTAKGEEIITEEEPSAVVMELSRQKAEEVASGVLTYNDEMITHVPMAVHKEARDILVIGADTVVAYENQILGKPKDEEDARRMLSMLSGKTHSVYTGVTFVFIDKAGRTGEHCFYEKTDVSMYTLTEEEIDRYISSGDPMDKAGSYGIQGRFAIHIKGIHGDYNNVVGLPVARLYQELRKLGVDV